MDVEKKTPAEKVGDDVLSQAWDVANGKEEVKEVETKEVEVKEVQEEKKEEKKEEIPPVEKLANAETLEDLDQKESSKLGRKVKGLYDRIDQLTSLVEKLTVKAPEPDIEVPEVITTREDVQRVLAAERQKEQREQAQTQSRKAEYEVKYMREINSLKDDNEDLHDEIFAEMMKSHNVKHSEHAPVDAKLNYNAAKASILTQKLASKETSLPVREKASKPPVVPGAGGSGEKAKTAVMPKLDPESASYVNYLKRAGGKTDEQIAKILAR